MALVIKALKVFFIEGPIVFLKKSFNFCRSWFSGLPPGNLNPTLPDFIVDYLSEAIGKNIDERLRPTDKSKIIINWIIPEVSIGSGGHNVIFTMVRFLEKFGHHNRIYLFGKSEHGSSGELKNVIGDNFCKLEAEVYNNIGDIKDSDVLIATSWPTAYPVKSIQNTKRKFYFVQDFEPWFYPMGSEYKMAENTYKFGFFAICLGPWLAKTITENYGMAADFFNLAYDPEIYRSQQLYLPIILENRAGDNFKTTIAINDIKKPKIICYGRPVTPRRCFELIVHSLKELHKRGLDFDLSFFGWDLAPYSMPFKFRNLRILAPEDLAKLYNWADLGVVFSPTNCSLLPHEMMACKLPVLELKGPTTEAIFKDGYNITLAEPNPISIADNIDYLLRNPDKRREIAENAYEYVRQFSWEKSAKKVEAILKKELT